MTKRYYMAGEYWYDTDTLEIDGKKGKFHNPGGRRTSHTNTIIKDHADYRSPVTGEVISGRYARREHMKKHNLREVDNTEVKPVYRNPDFCRKHNISPDRMGDPIKREARVNFTPPPGMAERFLRR